MRVLGMAFVLLVLLLPSEALRIVFFRQVI